jgi:hypothetical protein
MGAAFDDREDTVGGTKEADCFDDAAEDTEKEGDASMVEREEVFGL